MVRPFIMARRFIGMSLLMGSLAFGISACGYTPGQRALSGGALGAAGGAAIGAVSGGHAGTGALIGGGVGALTGAVTAP